MNIPYKKPNRGEDKFALHLDFAGYSYVREFKVCNHRKWRCDFYLPDQNIIVEIEGVTYKNQGGRHQTASGYICDCEKYNWIVSQGYILLRFTPSMVDGKAKRNATSSLIEPAIDTLDKYVLGDQFFYIDRQKQGYIINKG